MNLLIELYTYMSTPYRSIFTFDGSKVSQASLMSHVKGKSGCNPAIVILHTRYLSMECTLGIYVVNGCWSTLTFANSYFYQLAPNNLVFYFSLVNSYFMPLLNSYFVIGQLVLFD